MIRLFVFNLFLLSSCIYALTKWTRDAKIVATTTLVASFASLLRFHTYGSVEAAIFLIDLMVFAAFLYVAVRSDRFWPLWICGLQLTTIAGHIIKATTNELIPIAYAVALRFWSYPIQLILILAVWRACRRQGRVQDI